MVDFGTRVCNNRAVGLASLKTWFLRILRFQLGELAGQIRLRPVHVWVRQPASFTRLDWRPGVNMGSLGDGHMKPTQTEYKGVVYRSKCEAMFARYLDLRLIGKVAKLQEFYRNDGSSVTLQGSSGFVYEPYTSIEGWNPDFLVWRDFGFLLPVRLFEWVEYKPSRPTDAYVKRFAKHCLQWHSPSDGEKLIPNDCEFHIYYGNPYTYPKSPSSGFAIEPKEYDGKNIESVILSDGDVDNREVNDWLDNFVDDLMDYRFDLKDQSIG